MTAQWPSDLTFGVFDAATLDRTLPSPVVWLWQVQSKAGKVFASLVDGGSRLSHDNQKHRFLFRSTTTNPPNPDQDIDAHNPCFEPSDAMPQSGDVVRLDDYTYRTIVGKGEIVLLLQKVVILRHCDNLMRCMPRDALKSYPFDSAARDLKLMGSSDPPSTTGGSISNLPIHSSSSGMHSVRAAPYSAAPPPSSVAGDSTLGGAQYRMSGAGPVARRVDGPYVEIKNLTSFLGRWAVKGRFLNKGEPRTYSNQRGEGKIWSCDLMDSADECGTIRVTFFNKAVDKFFPMIKENEIYSVSRGVLRPANRKFNAGAHHFEMQLGEDAEIRWLSVDDPEIPLKPVPKVVPIADLAEAVKNTSVSVCGVCVNMSDLVEIIQRSTGQPKPKRELTIVDASSTCVDVTVWDSKLPLLKSLSCPPLAPTSFPLLLIENARVDEFNGRRLSTVAGTDIRSVPSNHSPEAEKTFRWFTTGGGKESLGQLASLTTSGWSKARQGQRGLSDRVTILELQKRATEVPDEELRDKGAWFTVRGTLMSINRDRTFYWMACPTCNRKVATPAGGSTSEDVIYNQKTDTSNVYCSHCGKNVDIPSKRYVLNCEVTDTTGTIRCGAMADKGTLIMGGIEPDVLLEAKAKGNSPANFQRFGDYFLQRLRREYIFRIQAKSEVYRDETRIRYRIFGADSLTGVMQGAAPNGPHGPAVARANLIREMRLALQFIYERITPINSFM